MNFLLKTIVFIFILGFIFNPTISIAQTPTPIDGVSISIDPEVPAPGKQAIVKLESYNTDLNSANIVWQVDNKIVSEGVGITKLNIVAPPIGKVISIFALITTAEGNEVKKGINIKSSDTDLIWESEGFIPPLYEGKAHFSYQNKIKIIAIPHIKGSGDIEADPKTLAYKWTVNNRVMKNQSGYGKQVLILKDELPVDLSVQVEIISRDGNQKSVAGMELKPGDPTLSFYEDNPLYGVYYNKSLSGNVRLKNNEISILAVPYYFSKIKDVDISRVWSINNIEQQDIKNNNSITLRTSPDSEGSSNISLEIRGVNDILQGAKDSINILFNKKKDETNVTF